MNSALDWLGRVQIPASGRNYPDGRMLLATRNRLNQRLQNGGMAQGSLHEMNRPPRSRDAAGVAPASRCIITPQTICSKPFHNMKCLKQTIRLAFLRHKRARLRRDSLARGY